MIEWLSLPLALVGVALIPKRKMSDEKKLQRIFIFNKIGEKRGEDFKDPKLVRKTKGDTYDTYIYNLPLGIATEAVEDLLPAMKEGLNKEVEIEHSDGLLKIDVFHQKLPTKWTYTKDLIRPDTWEVPIGKNHKGILYHDFDKYPHFIIGGVTRFGKTVLLKDIFNTLIMNQPDNVEVYFLDLKGGLEFYKYKALSQVKEVACDVFEAAQTLSDLVEELERTEKYFREQGISNIVDTNIKTRKFIIIDEGADLSPNIVTKDKKKYAEFCQSALSRLISKGGGLGYRILYCTQYPSTKSVDMSIKANIVARLSFITSSRFGSQVILDESGAEDLPAIPGRAIYLVEKKRTVQVPYIDDKMMFKMMEELEDVSKYPRKNRKPVNDDRQVRHGEDQTPTTHT